MNDNKLFEMDYTTITNRQCRASVVAESPKAALDVALAGLSREGIKVVTAGEPYMVSETPVTGPVRLIRLDVQ